jgi:glycosyltransferase involved in cell wall biosynthesis
VSIAVIIPAYRAETTLLRAIQSVQERPAVVSEIIVVVDGSGDRSAEIASSCLGVRVLVNETNQGAPASRNRGLLNATAEYIMFLDADDYIQPPLLEALAKKISESKGDVCFGKYLEELANGDRIAKEDLDCSDALSLVHSWLSHRFVPPCAILWRRAYLLEIGGWKEHLRKNQDGELVLRAVLMGARFSRVDDGYGIYSQIVATGRITHSLSQEALSSHLEVLDGVRESIEDRQLMTEKLERALAQQYYDLARVAFSHAQRVIGKACLQRLKKVRGGPEGTFSHRVGVWLLGLEKKEWLAAVGRGLLKRWCGYSRDLG